jgi:ATP-dependent Clp protease ATP-binding subunit ClpB
LANRGYDPVFGARPLKRLIQKELLDELAKMVLSGKLRDGETVVIDNVGGTLVFNAQLAGAPLVA